MPMTKLTYALALLGGLSLAIPAGAQTARNANIYDGTAHEPSPGPVHSDEKAAGVGLTPQQTQQQNSEVETLDRELTERANRDAAQGTPAPQPPNASGR